MSNTITLTSAQQELAAHHHDLIQKTMNAMKVSEDSIEDYYGIGAIALCNAARKYDEKKGIFRNFSIQMIRNAIKDEFRRKHAAKVIPEELVISLSSTLRSSNENIKLEEAIADKKDIEKFGMDALISEAFLRTISTRDQMILHLLDTGYTASEVAARLHISCARVKQLKDRIGRKMEMEGIKL